MAEKVTLENMTDDEYRYYYTVTHTRCTFIRRTPEQAIAELQKTRDYNEEHKAEFEAYKQTDGYKIMMTMYEVAGTLD